MKRKGSSAESLGTEISHLREVCRALKSENLRLHKKLAKLEAKYLTATNRVKALESEQRVLPKEPISDLEAARRIVFLLNKAGIDINGEPQRSKSLP